MSFERYAAKPYGFTHGLLQRLEVGQTAYLPITFQALSYRIKTELKKNPGKEFEYAKCVNGGIAVSRIK